MRRTGEGRKPSKTRRHPYSGHILGKAWFPRRGEEVPGNIYVTSLPGEKQGKRPSALWRASVSNPNFRFVSRFRSPPLTSGRLGFRCGRFLRPLLPVPPRSRWGDAGHPGATWGWGTTALLSRDPASTVAGRAGWWLLVGAPPAAAQVRGPGLRPRPALHRGRRPPIQPRRLGGGLPAPQWILRPQTFIPPSSGVCPALPPPCWTDSGPLGFWGLCLPSVLSHTNHFPQLFPLHSLAVAAALLSRGGVDSTSTVTLYWACLNLTPSPQFPRC